MRPLHYVILGAGYGTRLQKGIADDPTGAFAGLLGCPKPLLPVGNRTLAESWIAQLQPEQGEQIVIVTNGSNHALFEELVEKRDLSQVRLVCDGSASNDTRLGAVADMALAVTALQEMSGAGEEFDVCIIAGDTLFDFDARPDGAFFDVNALVSAFKRERKDSLVCYELADPTETLKRGILVLDDDGKVTEFLEKPKPTDTASRLACPPFYLFTHDTHRRLITFVDEKKTLPLEQRDSPGRFVQWLVEGNLCPVYASVFGGRRYDIGNLDQYKDALAAFGLHRTSLLEDAGPGVAVGRAFARMGLAGNPSDGYEGACMAFTIRNFSAEVVAHASDVFRIIPGKNDVEFPSLHAFHDTIDATGAHGGIRLVKTAAHRFVTLAKDARMRLEAVEDKSQREEGITASSLLQRLSLATQVTLQYQTSIPVMVGLAGSSAIVLATIRSLCAFYRIPPLVLCNGDARALPSHVLDAERALGISAGLQDRVAQAYEGLMFMDFAGDIVEKERYGRYERVPLAWLPKCVFLLHRRPSSSSVVHSNLRERWEKREESVMKAMTLLRDITERVRGLLSLAKGEFTAEQSESLADLIDNNFDVRESIVDISRDNSDMVARARDLGLACKFTGSGGALLALPRPSSFPYPTAEPLQRCDAVLRMRQQLAPLGIAVELVQT